MFIKSRLVLVYTVITCKVMALITVVDIGVLPLVKNSVGITFFIDITNEDRQNVCKLDSQCKKCCFIDADKEDCDVMMAFGEDIHIVKPRDRRTLLYVAPMLSQHDLLGYCDIKLIYDYNNSKEEIYVKLAFDTRVGEKKSKELVKQYVGAKKIKRCSTLDEDSLNNCDPVDCSIKYFDKRPVYDHILNKCVEVPFCLTDLDKELPDYVYVPSCNSCRNLDLPLTVQDIYAISTGLGTVTTPYLSTIEAEIKVQSNCSTISQNLNLIRNLMYGKICPTDNEVTFNYTECLKSAMLAILVCIVSTCAILYILVCCIHHTAWFYIQWSDGNLTEVWKTYRNPFKRRRDKRSNKDEINTTIRNALLREVVVKDIPLELRNSVIDVCDRIGKEVESKKRYRGADIGSQISLQKNRESLSSLMSSTTSLENDKE